MLGTWHRHSFRHWHWRGWQLFFHHTSWVCCSKPYATPVRRELCQHRNPVGLGCHTRGLMPGVQGLGGHPLRPPPSQATAAVVQPSLQPTSGPARCLYAHIKHALHRRSIQMEQLGMKLFEAHSSRHAALCAVPEPSVLVLFMGVYNMPHAGKLLTVSLCVCALHARQLLLQWPGCP